MDIYDVLFRTEDKKAFFYTDDEGRTRFAGGASSGGGTVSGSLPLHGDTVALRNYVVKYAETPAGNNLKVADVDRIAQEIARFSGDDKVQTHHYAEAAQYASIDSLSEIADRTDDSQIIERARTILGLVGASKVSKSPLQNSHYLTNL